MSPFTALLVFLVWQWTIHNECPVEETHETAFFFQHVPLHQTRKATDPRKSSTKEAYFEYNLQHRISFTNNSLQGHNRSTKMNLETKGSIRKKKNLT